jgi:hypothetical membrane protein
LRRISGVCGIASQLVGLTAILVVASISPWFSWTENDLSVLGIDGSTTSLFNSGLIATGLLSLVFAMGLGKSLVTNRVGYFGMASLFLGSISLSAVGLFPRSIDLPHDSASIAFFVFIALALLLIGIDAIVASQRLWGALSLVAAAVTLAFLLAPWPWTGGAIEQLLSCLPWALWTVFLGARLLTGKRLVAI